MPNPEQMLLNGIFLNDATIVEKALKEGADSNNVYTSSEIFSFINDNSSDKQNSFLIHFESWLKIERFILNILASEEQNPVNQSLVEVKYNPLLLTLLFSDKHETSNIIRLLLSSKANPLQIIYSQHSDLIKLFIMLNNDNDFLKHLIAYKTDFSWLRKDDVSPMVVDMLIMHLAKVGQPEEIRYLAEQLNPNPLNQLNVNLIDSILRKDGPGVVKVMCSGADIEEVIHDKYLDFTFASHLEELIETEIVLFGCVLILTTKKALAKTEQNDLEDMGLAADELLKIEDLFFNCDKNKIDEMGLDAKCPNSFNKLVSKKDQLTDFVISLLRHDQISAEELEKIIRPGTPLGVVLREKRGLWLTEDNSGCLKKIRDEIAKFNSTDAEYSLTYDNRFK